MTIHSVLFRLCSRLAVLWRRGDRSFSGEVAVPTQRVRQGKETMLGTPCAQHSRSEWTVVAPWASVLIAAVVAACASMPGALSKDSTAEVKQAAVSERINARWQALIKGDLDTAYTYMSAASQEAMPLKVYKLKHKPGMWRSVKIESLQCEAEICTAKMILTYDHERMKGIQTPFEESWIIEKGTAWYVNRERG